MKSNVLLFLLMAMGLCGCGDPQRPVNSPDDPEGAQAPVRRSVPVSRPFGTGVVNAAATAITPATAAAARMPEKLVQVLASYADARSQKQRRELVSLMSQMATDGVPRAQVAEALGTMLRMENSTEIKTAILDALSFLYVPEAVDAAITQLDPDLPLEVRIEAIHALERMDDKRAVPSLEKLFTDDDPDVQTAARATVASLHAPSPTAQFPASAVAPDIRNQPRRARHGKVAPVTPSP